MTSIEWLENELIEKKIIRKDNLSTYHDFPTTFELLFMEAKEMHKQEIIGAANQNEFEDIDGMGICETITKGEQFYSETFKKRQ